MFYIILLLLQLNTTIGTHGGYFVNLLQFPKLCPLTSFCAPWNPMGRNKSSILLIQHRKIELSVNNIYFLDSRGRLKKDDISCYFENSTEWCQLYSDTGYVVCDSRENQDFANDNHNEKHRYMVPKSCVEWKGSDSDHMTRAYYSNIQLKIPIFGRNKGKS